MKLNLYKVLTEKGFYELYYAYTEEEAIEQAFDEGFDVCDVVKFA